MHKITLPAWTVPENMRMNYFPQIDLKRTAHLCIDMQNSFVNPNAARGNNHVRDIIPNINRLTSCLRGHDVPTIWTRHTFRDEGTGAIPKWQLERNEIVELWRAGTMKGTPEHELHGELAVEDGDDIIDKYRMSCFIENSSNLRELLDRKNIDTLIITGTLTNACCESTARDAAMLDYKVLFLADATATINDEEHNAALLNLRRIFAHIVTTDELLDIVSVSARDPATA